MVESKLTINKIEGEIIDWIDVNDGFPDADSEVLIVFQRRDCDERLVTKAIYDDSDDDDGPWFVDGDSMCFEKVLYWAQMPYGPQETSKAKQ